MDHPHYFSPSHPRGPLHGTGGQSNHYHSSSFQQHYDLTCSNDGTSYNYGKRQRDSPVSSEGGEWQSSFKRLKVMDDGSRSPTEGSVYSFTSNHSSPDSRFDATPQTRPTVPQEHTAMLSPHTSQPRFVSQVPGEQSSEPSTGYQSMNSMLGQLHSLRQRRTEGAQPAAQHPGPIRDTMPLAPSTNRSAPPRKVVSLRTSSKLY